VAGVDEERAAFAQLDALLRRAAAANARALHVYRGTPAGDTIEGQLGHTLDRLAVLYGRGTYENLRTVDIVDTAVGNELRMAAVLDEPASTAARARARSLVDAARRGVRLHVREPAEPVRLLRGVYVRPLRQEFQWSLWAREEPYVRWRDGVIVIMDEAEVAALRAEGDEVDVLFLDPDELLDLDAHADRAAMDAELARRLAIALGSADRVGDSRDRYLLRTLLRQSVVLRNLRDRLAEGHPGAHAALLPILAEHTTVLAARLATAPAARAVLRDPLGASIDDEQEVQELVGRWATEPGDPAGLRARFEAVADAGTRLAELERHHP
jgi:hypothetical protein